MISWMVGWIWWFTWRVAITFASTLTIQHIIHEEDHVWIETKPLFIGAMLLVLLIRIWSTRGYVKETHDT